MIASTFTTQSKAPAGTKGNERHCQQGNAGRRRKQWKGETHQESRCKEDAPATKVGGKRSGRRHRQDGAGADAEEQKSEPTFVKSGPRLGEWYKWRPCRRGKAKDKEADARCPLLRPARGGPRRRFRGASISLQ